MPLKMYNTLSGKKEQFIPLYKGKVGMYVCGVTVYDNCHLGHARVAVIFDTIFRYFKYSDYDVTYVRNFTDVDDKIINKANKEGVTCNDISEKYIQEFHSDMSKLGILSPTHEPRAMQHIIQMVKMIKTLIDKGIAYEANGDVLYSVRDFPDYGKLSKRNLDDLQAGARVEPGKNKKDPLDFVLWKKSKDGEPSWDSPWGKGRPGWHIECSAMGQHYLGNTFDVHGGGMDLIFPHHENEIAQSEACTGEKYVNYWIHNGFVNVDKEKMSKSLKNFFTIKEILEKYTPETVRLFLLSTHYRSPLDFSEDSLKEMKGKLDRFYEVLKKIKTLSGKFKPYGENKKPDLLTDFPDSLKKEKILADFKEAMDDDINSALAIGNLFSVARDVNKFVSKIESEGNVEANICVLEKVGSAFQETGNVLGLFTLDPEEYFQGSVHIDKNEIEIIIAKRNEARKNRNWAEADTLRDELLNKGIALDDTTNGTKWKKIEG